MGIPEPVSGCSAEDDAMCGHWQPSMGGGIVKNWGLGVPHSHGCKMISGYLEKALPDLLNASL